MREQKRVAVPLQLAVVAAHVEGVPPDLQEAVAGLGGRQRRDAHMLAKFELHHLSRRGGQTL